MNMDIGIGKMAYSDMKNINYPASFGNDGKPDTRWSACDGNQGHWWKVDLGEEYYIQQIEIKWEKDNAYQYIYELSIDDENWIASNGSSHYVVASRITTDTINTWARFIKVTIIGGVSEEIKASFININIYSGTSPDFINGVDVSHLQQIEDYGGEYFNRKNDKQDCLEIFKDHNVNYVRLKVWNSPGLPYSDPKGYNNKAHVLEMSKRVKEHGFKLLIDFHYSDWWTDPGKQFMPGQWKDLSFEELKKAIYEFTFDVIAALKAQGTMPEMVQVGNEITNGMMWDVAKVSDQFDTKEQWDKLCLLLKNGLKAVKDVDASIRTIIHIERGGDNQKSRYFYDKLKERNVDFDIIGLSYYPIWHGSITDFKNNVNDIAKRYGKGIIVVETAFPYTTEDGDDTPNATTFPFGSMPSDYPATIQGQANIMQAIISVIKNIPDGLGLGFFYWQPDFIPVKGAGWKYGEGCEWDDQTMFDFTGHALWSLDIFKMHR